ncbi:serine/threonine-protein kinase fray2 [Aphis gossypii]|uniref:serine/threonine-protein kinase fray2 n=1 Tax=Aphis gossypii TaxID=80765 RepID=UPI00215923D9|nr:serine/threonine-protein kinase fray2 [Aphis gossypii]
MQLNTETRDSNQEIKRLNTKLEEIDSYYKNKIDKLCTEMSNLKKYDKTVNFEDRSRNRDKSPYSGKSNYKGWNNYRENSPYPDRYNNNRYRDNSKDTYDNKGYRENSRDRDRSYSRERKNSYDRSKNRSKDRGNNSNTKQYSRENSRERYSRSITPEKYNITCYKCNKKGHYANDCHFSKNE